MNRNEYQRQWRKENKRLNEYLNENSSLDEPVTSENEDVTFESSSHHSGDVGCASDESACHYSGAELGYSCESSTDEEILNFLCDNYIDNNDENKGGLSSEIAQWVLRNKITRTASDELLSILRNYGHENELPKDSRTLLGTPRNVQLESKCGGEYSYLGIKKGIARAFRRNPGIQPPDNKIKLCVNVDGLPIFKSSSGQFWPILCNFCNLMPFTVAIYYGTSKPTDLKEFLEDFFAEFSHLKLNGYENDGITYQVSIFTLPCDAPARQFMKCIKAHNGYFGCERCVVEGVSVSRRMVFHEVNCEKRNDESFRSYDYAGTHQLDLTCLIEIDIGCITQFPLDYMHLVCLGVVKRLLFVWKEGVRPYKLSFRQINMISMRLEKMNGTFPSEFSRQPRGLKDLKRWKATEFRMFMLYTGLYVLHDILDKERYEHFLTLTVAFRILLESDNCVRNANLQYARELLQFFVSKSQYLYGDTFTVFNVHSLIHIADDAEFHNCSLDCISSFPFENHLQFFKKFIRKAQNPLAQIVRRIGEFDEHCVDFCTHKNLTTKFTSNWKDSWFLLKNGDFAQIQSVSKEDTFICRVYRHSLLRDFFSTPCHSKLFNIVVIEINYKGCLKEVHKRQFLRKVAGIKIENGLILSSLLNNIL